MWYVTLTYNQEHLPPGGNLVPEHLVGYLKRLRKNTKSTFKYLACGEYGDKKGRPHYHLIIFTDREHTFELGYCKIRKKITCLESPFVEAWSINNIPNGFVDVVPIFSDGDAARIFNYVVEYVLKGVSGYRDTQGREAEFLRMSKKLGIKEIPKIAKMLKTHDVGTEYQDVAVCNNLQMIKFGGRLYPIGRYLRSALISELGGEDATDLQKAIRGCRKIYIRELTSDLEKEEEEENERAARGRKAFRQYMKNRKL